MTVYLPIVEGDTGAIAAEKILNSVNTKVDKSEYQEKIGQIEHDISGKADSSNVYNKTEVYNKNETYNKTEVDRAIPDVSDFITKDVENLSNYYKKTETYTKQETDNAISTAVSSVYKYKGSKENYSDLPSSGQSVGDTYNIINADETHDIKAGDNVSWNGTAWDKLAGTIDLSEYFNKEDNTSDNITEGTSHLMMTPAERTKLGQQSGINTGDQVASDFDVKDLQDTANRLAVVSATAPSNPTQGQMRYDTTTDILKTYNGTSWNVTSNFPGMTILSYGHNTWQDFIDAYNNNAIVYCRASSGSNPGSGSQTRMAFMAYVNNAESPTEVEFQYYRSVSTKSATNQGDEVYVYKLTKTAGRTVEKRNTYTKIVAGTGLTSTWSNGVLTISLA